LVSSRSIGSTIKARRLVSLIPIDINISPKGVDGVFGPSPANPNAEAITVPKTVRTKLVRIAIPEILPLSGVSVESARKAIQLGKPSPNDAPANIPKANDNSLPRMKGIGTSIKAPKVIHRKRNFLRFTLSAIALPIVAEITVEIRNMLAPALDQKSFVNPVNMSSK